MKRPGIWSVRVPPQSGILEPRFVGCGEIGGTRHQQSAALLTPRARLVSAQLISGKSCRRSGNTAVMGSTNEIRGGGELRGRAGQVDPLLLCDYRLFRTPVYKFTTDHKL